MTEFFLRVLLIVTQTAYVASQAFFVAWNIHHGHTVAAALNAFFGVWFSVLLARELSRRRRSWAERRLEAETVALHIPQDEPPRRAWINLVHVTKLVGATQMNVPFMFRLRVGKHDFVVSPALIFDDHNHRHTCYQIRGENIPQAEKMATALLLLHRNPSLFDQWRGDYTTPYS